MKELSELISKLKDLGFIIVLATMTTQEQLEVYSKTNKKMMKQMNIEKTFDWIIKIDDVKNKKPNPEIFNTIVKHYNATSDECLVFEDSYTGVLACKKAGIEVVNIYDQYADVDRDKINEITDYSISDYQEFIDFVNSSYSTK